MASIFEDNIKDKKIMDIAGHQIWPHKLPCRTRAVKGRESLTTRGKSFQ